MNIIGYMRKKDMIGTHISIIQNTNMNENYFLQLIYNSDLGK